LAPSYLSDSVSFSVKGQVALQGIIGLDVAHDQHFFPIGKLSTHEHQFTRAIPGNTRGQFRFDPDYDPYRSGADFVYHPKWTGRYFNLLRVVFKCIAIDPHVELVEAWRAIVAAGGPERVPQAMAVFDRLPFSYSEAAGAAAALRLTPGRTPADIAAVTRSWSDLSRKNYIEAARLAREGR